MAALILISWATLTQICLLMQKIFAQYILCPRNFSKNHKYSEGSQVPNIMDWHHHCEEKRINKRANTFKSNSYRCKKKKKEKEKKKGRGGVKRRLHALTILYRNWQGPFLLHNYQRDALFKNNVFKNWFKNNALSRETLAKTGWIDQIAFPFWRM